MQIQTHAISKKIGIQNFKKVDVKNHTEILRPLGEKRNKNTYKIIKKNAGTLLEVAYTKYSLVLAMHESEKRTSSKCGEND